MPLIINDKRIDRISGPVSFSLLKPKKYVFDKLKKEGVRLPIMMLFGDRHYSEEQQCDTCTCSSEGCCMPVYSEDFLQLIDSLSTKEHPIDFNIEGFVGKKTRELLKNDTLITKNKQTTKEPMRMLRENMLACYIKELRGTELYKKHCPTKNIRWHFGDARSSTESKYDLEYLITSFQENKKFKAIYSSARNIDEIKDAVNSYKKFVGGDDIYKGIIEFQLLKSFDIEEAIDHFFSMALINDNSLIMKQLFKLSSSLSDAELWKNAMVSSLKYENKHLKYENKSRTEFYELLLNEDYETLDLRLKDITFRTNMFYEGLHLLKENSIFLDFYYILRAFKVPRGDVNPFLSISYFGISHRDSIFNILVNILGYYEVVESVTNSKDTHNMRCLNIPSKIDFNELALGYNVNIRMPVQRIRRSFRKSKRLSRRKSPYLRRKSPRKK